MKRESMNAALALRATPASHPQPERAPTAQLRNNQKKGGLQNKICNLPT
jgi:hypothetical protein